MVRNIYNNVNKPLITFKQISYRNIHKLDINAFISIYYNSITFDDITRNIIDIFNEFLILILDRLCPLKHRIILNRVNMLWYNEDIASHKWHIIRERYFRKVKSSKPTWRSLQ